MHLEPLYQQTICFGHKEIHTTTHSSPFDVSKMGIPTWIQTPLLQYFSDTPNFVMFEEAGSINRTVLRLRGEHSLLKTIEVKKMFSLLPIFAPFPSQSFMFQFVPNCLQTLGLPTNVTLQISSNDSL